MPSDADILLLQAQVLLIQGTLTSLQNQINTNSANAVAADAALQAQIDANSLSATNQIGEANDNIAGVANDLALLRAQLTTGGISLHVDNVESMNDVIAANKVQGDTVEAITDVSAGRNVIAGQDISAGRDIAAVHDIRAGNDIEAVREARADVVRAKTTFAGEAG